LAVVCTASVIDSPVCAALPSVDADRSCAERCRSAPRKGIPARTEPTESQASSADCALLVKPVLIAEQDQGQRDQDVTAQLTIAGTGQFGVEAHAPIMPSPTVRGPVHGVALPAAEAVPRRPSWAISHPRALPGTSS
jgi:hypothetical protein